MRLVQLLVVLVLALAAAACGEDETAPTTDTTTTTTTKEPPITTAPPPGGPALVRVRVRVVGGVPKGGIVRETVDQGDSVVLVVTADVSDHVHLHGYDIMRDVAPGRVARIRFRASVPGRFQAELEDRRLQIAEITVQP